MKATAEHLLLATLDMTLSGHPMAGAGLRALVREGASFSELPSTLDHLGLKTDELLQVIGISPATFSRRRRSGLISGQQVDGLLRVARILALATQVLGSKEKAQGWLMRPRPQFDGLTPLRMLDRDATAREVENLLHRVANGIVS